ncbi:MAG TPA: dienelactone hydrolase family protein [Ktedonobacteraceae bacterium]|nr:dienelactone hydrolase family protein [Ktedonobacteraceae bacterium]
MTNHSHIIQGPHQGQPVLLAGEPISHAKAAMVMLHGRGASAQDILELASELKQPGFAYIAPQAAGNAWYPNSFLAPIASNEPALSSAFLTIENILAQLNEAALPMERTIILGFSQGACLSLEFIARNAKRYGGVVGLSGGLIGPDGIARNYNGSLAGTPVFLGCSDKDPHIPKERVEFTAAILQNLGGGVTAKLYPNLAHTVNPDEIRIIRTMMAALISE